MNRIMHHTLTWLGVLLTLTLPCTATNYHVNADHASASDGNPGTPDQPLKTLQRAAELAQPGDTVFITGLYHESLYIEHGGAEGAPIVFAAAPDAQAVIDGGTGDPGSNGIVSTHSWLCFEGLEIRNWSDNGMWFEGGSNLIIRDCEVHHVFYGIGMTDGCHDFLLERVVMHHFDLYGFDASPGTGPCYNGRFIDCVSHTGRDLSQNVDGFALGHGNQHDFLFIRCETYGVYDGFDISSRETTLERCSAHDCLNGGYKLWQDEILLVNCLSYHNDVTNAELDWDGDPGSVTMWNCTFHDAGMFNIWVENSGDSLFMYNCIISGGDLNGLAFELRDTRNYFGDHNIFHNDNPDRLINVGYEDQYPPVMLNAWQTATGQDAHSIALSTDAGLYVNAGGYDLHLAATSSARDNGVAAGAPVVDFEGNPRPAGPAVDIGAYEYQSQTAIPAHPERGALSLTAWPNPSHELIHFQIASARPVSARFTVYDITGRTLHQRIILLGAGETYLEWNGRTDAGLRVHGFLIAVLHTPFGTRQMGILMR